MCLEDLDLHNFKNMEASNKDIRTHVWKYAALISGRLGWREICALRTLTPTGCIMGKWLLTFCIYEVRSSFLFT